MIKGIHHISSITSSAKETVKFYANILGLRLIKKTVNFDSPETYHLYFGNNSGQPGTAITFFPIDNLPIGTIGKGQVTVTQFSVPEGSLKFWNERLTANEVKILTNTETIIFEDYDGLRYELVEDKENTVSPYTKVIAEEFAIKSFYGGVLDVEDSESSHKVITELLGYENVNSTDTLNSYEASKSHGAKLTLKCNPNELTGVQGTGTVHHIAFRVENDDAQLELREKITQYGLHPTPVIDRKYFKSVYFREPGGILYEIATAGPGFDVDESIEDLGSNLMLPEQYEPYRKDLVKILGEI